MSTLRFIHQEINREAAINKAIDKIVKRWLKQPIYKKYKRVSQRSQCEIIMIFMKSNIPKFTIVLNDPNCGFLDEIENDDHFSLIYFKNLNPHDAKRQIIGHIKNLPPCKQI